MDSQDRVPLSPDDSGDSGAPGAPRGAVSPDLGRHSAGPYVSPLHAAPGQMVMLENGRSTMFLIGPGQRVLIGRGPGADLVIYDARVSSVHALIERQGPGWLVTGLDATGRPHPVATELGLRSGTLLIGGCQVLLHAPRV